MRLTRMTLTLVCLGVLACAVGCASPMYVEVTYHFKARTEIPEYVKKVTVAMCQDYRGEPGTGEMATNDLTQMLMKARGKPYDLVERGPGLKAIIEEQQFAQSDWTEPPDELAAQARIAGVDAFIWGKITKYNSNTERSEITKFRSVRRGYKRVSHRDRKGRLTYRNVPNMVDVPYQVPVWDIEANFGVTFKMVSVRDARILAVGSPEWPLTRHFEGQKGMSEDQLLAECQKNAIYMFLKEIAPWFETKRHQLDKAGGKNGCTLASKKLFPQAEKSFRAEIELNRNNAAAYYNLGLVLAGQEKLDEAYDALNTAVEMKPNKILYMDALTYLQAGMGKAKTE